MPSSDLGPNSESQLDSLKRELTEAQVRIKQLEAEILRLGQAPPSNFSGVTAHDASIDITPLNEIDTTLRRLVQRIAMILQCEKIAIMFYDRELGELIGIPPSFGIDDEHLRFFRVRASQGVSGEVFREGKPIIFHDVTHDARTQKDPFGLLHVLNGVTVPLVIEKRDEENRVVDRNTIGVLHAFNKRHGDDFNDEDLRLLERMAKNVGSIIANLQLYRQVVEDREELLQTFESLTAGLLLVSPENRLSQINASARAIFELTSDAIGKSMDEVLKHDPIRRVVEESRQGEGAKSDLSLAVLNSERTYEIQGAQVRSEENKDLGVVVILNDITDIRNIDKMKSAFVAMASHELRTPLTAIKGFVSTLLMDEDFTAEERREFHLIIDHECDRLKRLIDDLLNTARIEAGESLKPNFERVAIGNLLEKVVRVQQQASSHHKVILKVHNELPWSITGDEDKLDQIFTNLLNNAIKYSPGGGEVVVHATNEGDTLLFAVQDQGIGIPKEHLSRVFERFHRVNNEDNRKIYGTGLGLFLVQHLVERVHLGKIWVDSEVGKGSTFYFRIPTQLDVEKAMQMND